LGLTIDESLKWISHIELLQKSLSQALFAIRTVVDQIDETASLAVYHSYFISRVRYGIIFWGNSTKSISIFQLQKIY